MFIFRRRYRRRPPVRSFIFKYINRFYLKYWIIAGAVLVAALVGAAIVNATRVVSAEETAFASKKHIVVGIGERNPSFASIAPDGGATGFEPDLLRALIGKEFPDAQIDFVHVEEQEVSFLLRNGEIDLALAMLPRDVLKTQGLTLSNGYFMDAAYAFTRQESGVANLNGLNGRRVYAMSTEVKTSEIGKALENMSIKPELVGCSSYPDALDALASGAATAVICPRYKMYGYSDGLTRVEPAVVGVSYRIAAWKTNSKAITLINQNLKKLRSSGEHAELLEKWDIQEYAAEK